MLAKLAIFIEKGNKGSQMGHTKKIFKKTYAVIASKERTRQKNADSSLSATNAAHPNTTILSFTKMV
jgi:hypothetical protein